MCRKYEICFCLFELGNRLYEKNKQKNKKKEVSKWKISLASVNVFLITKIDTAQSRLIREQRFVTKRSISRRSIFCHSKAEAITTVAVPATTAEATTGRLKTTVTAAEWSRTTGSSNSKVRWNTHSVSSSKVCKQSLAVTASGRNPRILCSRRSFTREATTLQ